MVKNNLRTVSTVITHSQLKDSRFRTVISKYRILNKRKVYYAEEIAIERLLKKYGIQETDIVNIAYSCGFVGPYKAVNMPIASMYDEYHIHIQYELRIIENPHGVTGKEEVKNMFYLCGGNIERKKQVYKKLMLKYHPDRGGDTEITKYINSFKNW